jgi:hypothetical protein
VSRLLPIAASALAVVLLAACGDEGEGAGTDAKRDHPGRAAPKEPAAERLLQAGCPADAANCRAADGRIVYVERVDPDGDGDAHFVLLSDESITAPGLTVVDVRRGLRPQPLPGPGDELSAAGPVFSGSYGQRQIQADEVHVARR